MNRRTGMGTNFDGRWLHGLGDAAMRRTQRLWAALKRRTRRAPLRAWIAPVEIGLVLVIAFFAAQLVWVFAEPDPRSAGHAELAVAYAAAQPASVVRDYAALTEFDPFHQGKSDRTAPAAEHAPATSLDLSLQGTRAGGGSQAATAIIRLGNGAQRLYRVGDQVVNGVIVRAIYPDRVMLGRGGALEGLYFDDDEARRAMRRRLAAAQGPQADGPAHAAKLFKSIRLEPRLLGGRLDGVVIAADGPATILKQNGLIAGDVLLAVNDRPIDSVAGAKRLLQDLQGAASVIVLIERDGERLSRTITLGG